MLAALLVTLSAFSAQAEPTRIELYRGAPGPQIRYWDVSDTSLDSRQPNVNFGGRSLLEGGPGKVILIRFGDLARMTEGRRRVVGAKLHLTQIVGNEPVLREVRRVKVPWGEGPRTTLTGLRPAEGDKAPDGSATWNDRRAGSDAIGWQQRGAMGPEDGELVSGVKIVSTGNSQYAIEGLGMAVQAMLDRPYENEGFALIFESEVAFQSSEANRGVPRLELALAPAETPTGPDLAVTRIESIAEGEYRAQIQNVGDTPSQGFTATWIVRERKGARMDSGKPLQPGESMTLTIAAPIKRIGGDRRRQPLGILIQPLGRDARAENDGLTIDRDGVPLTIAVSKTSAEALGRPVEEWAQAQVRFLNDTVFAQSRFSFALEGVKERVRLQAVTLVEEGAQPPAGAAYAEAGAGLDLRLLKTICLGLGVPALEKMNGAAGSIPLPEFALRASTDRFGGLLGGGETRWDGGLPSQIDLPNEPVFSAILESTPMPETDLLSMTAVAILNRRLDGLALQSEAALSPLPITMLIRPTDLAGRSLGGTEFAFFAPEGGKYTLDQPLFTVLTSETGTAFLPKDVLQRLVAEIKDRPERGALLVRCVSRGQTEWAWLKLWRLMDAYARGNTAAAVIDLPFNVPTEPLEPSQNLAENKIVTDSGGGLPAQLIGLIDGKLGASVALSGEEGAWVEVDLGRDRPVAEVRLAMEPGAFWNRFDILFYATGQQPIEALKWARELDGAWTLANRAGPAEGSLRWLTYRGAAARVRFIRIVNREKREGASLAEIRVTPAQFTEGAPPARP